jgi:hypothetical protein
MMSCMASAAWSHPISSLCCTEHGQRRCAVLLGRITTVVMSRNDQLDQCCTVEPHCSGMSTHLVNASVTRECTFKTRKPSYVPRTTKHFFIPVVHNPLGS